jgi:hypothetical protein
LNFSTLEAHWSSRAYSRAVVLVALVVSLLVLVVVGRAILIHWSPQRQLELKQEGFIKALEKHNGKKLLPYLATDYMDQWEFDRDDAVLAVSDVGSHFMILTVSAFDVDYRVEGRQAVVKSKLQLSGSGSPVANEVIRVVNRQPKAFVFTWKRQSFWPGSWRVVRIEHPGLPVDLYGYRPGDLKKMLEE